MDALAITTTTGRLVPLDNIGTAVGDLLGWRRFTLDVNGRALHYLFQVAAAHMTAHLGCSPAREGGVEERERSGLCTDRERERERGKDSQQA